MIKEIEDSIRNVATFALGAYKASDNNAFNVIYENLISICEQNNESIDDIKNLPIYELYFTQRTHNCLIAENINFVKDLISKSEADLLKTPNLGRKSLKEIEKVLAEKGLKLR